MAQGVCMRCRSLQQGPVESQRGPRPSAVLVHRLFLCTTLLTLWTHTSGQGSNLGPRERTPVDDAAIVEAAQFALKHLRNLSDSGIYTTLELWQIKSAEVQEGVFHHNTFLTLDIACPHFRSLRVVEEFKMIVMRSRADGSVSIAVNEFPDMREDAIEEFWIRKVEEKKLAREKFITELLQEEHEREATMSPADAQVPSQPQQQSGGLHSGLTAGSPRNEL